MKKFATILIALASLFTLSSCNSAPEWEMVEKIKTTCPGWQVNGQCLPFAKDLAARMTAAGYKARVVIFTYYVKGNAGSVSGATHAVVAYTARGHEIWIQDNTVIHPVWVDKNGRLNWGERLKQFLMTAYSTYDPVTLQPITQVGTYYVTSVQVND